MTTRPYAQLRADDLYALATDAHAKGDVDTWNSAMEEYTNRTSSLAATHMEELQAMGAPGQPSDGDWLDKARAVVAGFRKPDSYEPSVSVYIVELHDPERDDPHGLYVGQTGKTPEERFEQHLAGEKAGRKHVTWFGVGLLPELYEHLNPMTREDAIRLEKEIAIALRGADYWVEGGH